MTVRNGTEGEQVLRVEQIFVYPIKSLRGVSLNVHHADFTGFSYDRRFMLRRLSDHKNMHISDFTEMCLFTTSLMCATSSVTAKSQQQPDTIEVSYNLQHVFNQPDQSVIVAPLQVPLDLADRILETLTVVTVNMHSSPTPAYDMGSRYNDWFSTRFGYPVQLLYLGNNRRKVLGNVPPHIMAKQRDGKMGSSLEDDSLHEKPGSSWLGSLTSTANLWLGVGRNEEAVDYDGADRGISFADCAPFLFINHKSWENVQNRLPQGEEFDISKLRPNIVISGAEEAFDEDYWAELQVGDDIKFVLTQNCGRCNSLNVDYKTGKVGTTEAGKVLKKMQSDRRVDYGAKYTPIFGRYGFLFKPREEVNKVSIRVGDEVRLVKRNAERMKFEWPHLSTK